MATFTISIECDNTTGSTNFLFGYRLSGGSTWTLSNVTPGTTATATTPVLLNNRIYEFQFQNINGSDNPYSTIYQNIGFTDPTPVVSPTNVTVGYSFSNLSQDITSYTVQLTTFLDPGIVIETDIIPAGSYPGILSGTFVGLSPTTQYRLVIIPVAGSFIAPEPFVTVFTTQAVANCANITSLTSEIL